MWITHNEKPQGNTSKAFKKYDTEDKNTVARMMLERNIDVSEIIKKTDYENIDIITANMDLLEANLRTIVDTGRQQQTRFKKALSNSKVLDHGWAKFDYHAHKDNQMYKLLKGGTRKLKQSLISVITTAGFNLNAPCYELYKYCRRVLRGIDVNDRQFIYIAQMDVNDDIWNPKNWIKCCPLTGNDPELLSQMQEDAKKAKSMGGEEMRDFLTKSLNIWVTNAETAFIDLAEWEKCGSNRTLEDFRGKKAICGLDLSSGGDLTSLALIFPYEDPNTGDKKYYIYSHSFIPQRRMQEHMDNLRKRNKRGVRRPLFLYGNFRSRQQRRNKKFCKRRFYS